MNSSGKNLTDIQQMNRSLVLRLMLKNNICSRARLAQESGLKQATITNIMNDFLEWGIVEETGLMARSKGRRSIGVSISHNAFYVIGIRLTRNFFTIGLFDISGALLHGKEVANAVSSGPASVIAAIKKELAELMRANADKTVLAVGMAVPGPYFFREGKIELLTDFPGWNSVNLREEIQKAVDVPVIIDHDANAGALAEWWIAPNEMMHGTIVYMAVGQGLGAGIINDGTIFRGALGVAGEVGHATVDIHGPLCACGNRGCLTNYACTTYLLQRTREIAAARAGTNNTLMDFPQLVAAIRNGEPAAVEAYREVMEYLAVGIISVIWAYGPNEIIIGDAISAIGPSLIDTIQELMKGRTLEKFTEQVTIRLSSFEEDPAFIGAAALAIDHCLTNTHIFVQPGSPIN